MKESKVETQNLKNEKLLQQRLLNQGRVKIRGLYIADTIDLKALEWSERLSNQPLTFNAGDRGVVVIFRYGVIIFYNIDALEEANYLKNLNSFLKEPFSSFEQEEAEIIISENDSENVYNGKFTLKDLSIEKIQLIADILAKSLVLAKYETNIASVFDKIEPLAKSLKNEGKRSSEGKALLNQIGSILLIQNKMVGRVEVTEKPDILWDRPELEKLYLRLESEYELHERHLALERKLDLVSKTAETMLDLLQHISSLRVEWYIVILIVFEIFLSIYELFFK